MCNRPLESLLSPLSSFFLFCFFLTVDVARYLVGQSTNSDITRVGNSLFFLRNSMTRPNDIWSLELQNSIPHQITRVNDNQLTSFNVSIPKRFSFVGSLGDTVYGIYHLPQPLLPHCSSNPAAAELNHPLSLVSGPWAWAFGFSWPNPYPLTNWDFFRLGCSSC